MDSEVADDSRQWYYLAKDFYDYADDIDAVLIHYAYAAYGTSPDWEQVGQVQPMALLFQPSAAGHARQPSYHSTPAAVRHRRVLLKLPAQIDDAKKHTQTNRYLLHYYFEIIQDGTQVKTMSYTDDVRTSYISSSSLPIRQAA